MSRNFERIDIILKELETYWKANPDLRLSQIVSNIAKEGGFDDPFYFEDDIFLSIIKNKNA